MDKVPLKTILFLLLLPLLSLAQQGIVKGVLTTETDGLPLPGASIVIKGTSKGVQTDFDVQQGIKIGKKDKL